MPSISDNIRVTFISELAGVQMSNQTIWRVDALGATPTPGALLADLANEYDSVISAVVVPEWKISCVIYENLTVTEAKFVTFTNLPGNAVGDFHPQNQVIRFNRWGLMDPTDDITIVSSFSQSGVTEALSTRGRLNDASAMIPMASFLTQEQILSNFGTVEPMLFGKVQFAFPPVLITGFRECRQTRVNPTFLKLASRRTNLCSP